MHQHSFSQGLSSFFQRLAHRFGADAVHDLAFNQLVRQQSQGPAGPALRRLGAGQGNQVSLPCTIQLPLPPVELLPAPQGCFQALLHAAAAHPLHRGGAHLQGLDNLLVLHGAVSLVLVAKQQDAGVSLPIGCHPPSGHQHH